MRHLFLLLLSLLAVACGGQEQVEPGVCELGSVYGDAPVIDPAAPVYSDADWTQEQVEEAFATLPHDDSAWRAYAFAASEQGSLLECAFCACGCKSTAQHQSAIDCFKDMHGFT